MKDNKIFKIIIISIAVMSVCGVIIYSLITFTSKSDSDTVSYKNETTEQTTKQGSEEEKTTEITEIAETPQITEASEMTETVSPETSATIETVNPEIMYGNILSLYKKALSEEWEYDLLKENNLNYLCRYYKGTGLDDIGYTFYDINSDGIAELIVGEIEDYIFDVYTYQDEQAILIAQSGERHWYDICEDGKISTKGSSGATTSFYEFYVLEAGAKELKYIECVALDFDLNPDNPYFYTTKGPYQDYTQIDEETANNIMGKYKGVNIGKLTPFAQYN